MKNRNIFLIGFLIGIILMNAPYTKVNSQSAPQIEMYMTEYASSGGVLSIADNEYDYTYKGEGLLLIYVEFFAPNVFEVILSKNAITEKYWSSGIFENDTVEYVWNTAEEKPGDYKWSFVAFNFGQIPVVNASLLVKIEGGAITPTRVILGVTVIATSLFVLAWYFNQRSRKQREKR